MRKTHRWQIILAYGGWLLVLGLGIWFLLLARSGFLGVSAAVYIGESTQRVRVVKFLDKILMLTIGLGWLVTMVVTEPYFRHGVTKGDLFYRLAHVLGIELLLIFAADAMIFALQGFSIRSWFRWSIFLGELLLGAALTILARRLRRHSLRS